MPLLYNNTDHSVRQKPLPSPCTAFHVGANPLPFGVHGVCMTNYRMGPNRTTGGTFSRVCQISYGNTTFHLLGMTTETKYTDIRADSAATVQKKSCNFPSLGIFTWSVASTGIIALGKTIFVLSCTRDERTIPTKFGKHCFYMALIICFKFLVILSVCISLHFFVYVFA